MKILFICTGNTCRSPMAEGIFRKIAEERNVTGYSCRSAGLCTETGLPATTNAVTACKEIGVDLSGHRSFLLNDELVEKADLLVVMTKDHEMVLSSIGIPQEKIKILGDGIPDPYGSEIEIYRQCRDSIAAGVAHLLDALDAAAGRGEAYD